MFTGLITDVGIIRDVRRDPAPAEQDARFVISTGFDVGSLAIGASIACAGVCLTVVERDQDSFAVDVSAETLSKTTLGSWMTGTYVNLEASLRLGDELGGHLVSGHIDATARVIAKKPEGDSWRFTFEVPSNLAKFIAPKGSVALDGVSLTVNEVQNRRFGVNIIPHTFAVTTFNRIGVEDLVNLEVDMLSRYVARQMEAAWPT